jgi:hypothetical protein
MANCDTIAKRFTKRGDMEGTLLNMFHEDDRFILFANDFTEEAYGDDKAAKLVLFYVRVKATDCREAPPLRKDCDVHVGTWNKTGRKGWIFQTAYDLIQEEAA